MNKSIYVLVAISLIVSGTALYTSMNQAKIAYIRSSELVYSYEGMKESQQVFQSKKLQDQANVDTLRIELERAYSSYSKEIGSLNAKDKKERQTLLQHQQQNYLQYAQAMKEKEKKEETLMTEGVLNQINSFVEEYSKDHGYDIVFGTTNSGNLLYAKDAMDITKEVLQALNATYKTSSKEINTR